jgi:hypothetical protein
VKGDVVHRNAVNPGFGLGDPAENIQGPLLCPFPEGRLFDEPAYILPGIMGMVFVVIPAALVMVIVFMMIVPVVVVIRRLMFVRFVVMGAFMMRFAVLGEVIPGAARINQGAKAGYAVSAVGGEFELPAVQAEGAQLLHQFPGIDSQIDQGPQGHIAGNTGKAIKVQNLHCFLL